MNDVCPNCDIEMDVKDTPRFDIIKDEVCLSPMISCGICSYGWFIDEKV